MKVKYLVIAAWLSLSIVAQALPKNSNITKLHSPQPTSCIQSQFIAKGNKYWKNIKLILTNQCNKGIDFQNALVTFETKKPLNTDFWGDFSPLPYPDGSMQISSSPSNGHYLASLTLHFPNYGGSTTVLPANSSITIKYAASADTHTGSAIVYTDSGSTPTTGSITLNNNAYQPSGVTQTYALVHVTNNGQKVTDIQLPWRGQHQITNLAAATYQIQADQVTNSAGDVYAGTATPNSINVTAESTATSNIDYALVQQEGKLNIALQTLPSELSGYSTNPSVQITEVNGNNSVTQTVAWNSTELVSNLVHDADYTFSTSAIAYNDSVCNPVFTPSTVTANGSTPPTTQLTYSCSTIPRSNVSINVSGAPQTLSTLNVTLTPNDSTAAVQQVISLSSGSGNANVSLKTGVIYQVSSDQVNGYNFSYSPQPLTASDNAVEEITLTQQTGTPVSIHGQLHVCGTHLCDVHDQTVQLKGMSSHGIQWYGWKGSNTESACLTTKSLDQLTSDWHASIMRVSMYVQEDGYETDPTGFTLQVNQLIDELTARGVYVIVDWHMLDPGDPNYNLDRAKQFFSDIANAHLNNNNLLYEIANEPSGVSWSTIKSYANELIPYIRAIDPTTPILVGTPGWSSLGVSDGRTPDDIINSPLNYSNVMYTFHFYAASHKSEYYNALDYASDHLPIFVTEFGTQRYTGDGSNDFNMTDQYMALMQNKQISWTNWNYSDDFRSGAVWQTGTCQSDNWADSNLKEAGVYIKDKILN